MAGMSDLGGVKFFNLSVDTPNGDLDVLELVLQGKRDNATGAKGALLTIGMVIEFCSFWLLSRCAVAHAAMCNVLRQMVPCFVPSTETADSQ
jgi:hypothetical protein